MQAQSSLEHCLRSCEVEYSRMTLTDCPCHTACQFQVREQIGNALAKPECAAALEELQKAGDPAATGTAELRQTGVPYFSIFW